MTPLFIETEQGRYINAALVVDVIPSTAGGCHLYTNSEDYQVAEYTPHEFVARVNNALALMQMIERAAR